MAARSSRAGESGDRTKQLTPRSMITTLVLSAVGRRMTLLGLRVAVHDARAVKPGQRRRQLDPEVDRLFDGQPRLHRLGQRAALDELGGEDGAVDLVYEVVDDAREVIAFGTPEQQCLALEPHDDLGHRERAQQEELHGHAHSRRDVLGRPDLPHAADADATLEPVAPTDQHPLRERRTRRSCCRPRAEAAAYAFWGRRGRPTARRGGRRDGRAIARARRVHRRQVLIVHGERSTCKSSASTVARRQRGLAGGTEGGLLGRYSTACRCAVRMRPGTAAASCAPLG